MNTRSDTVFSRHVIGTPETVRETLIDIHASLTEKGIARANAETLQIVLAEILNNVVEHAYADTGRGPIDVLIKAMADGLWCEVRDEGLGMPGGELPAGRFPDIDLTNIHALPEGGFGWAMVRDITSFVDYERFGGTNFLRFKIPSVPTAE